MNKSSGQNVLSLFHPAVQSWFQETLGAPTTPQREGWPAIARGESTLILAPTGTGKTLTAFLWCLHRLLFSPVPPKDERCRVIYVSPLKALAVDVERNLQQPLLGISQHAEKAGFPFHCPQLAVRTGDTTSQERSRFQRNPADILITTPESLYLLLTSHAREALRSVDTLIVDEIHALVPTKRGAHLALSMERLEKLCQRKIQRIGLSATQRPLEEVARYLGGVESINSPTGPIYRPVTIVGVKEPKQLNLRVEMPIEEWARRQETASFSLTPDPAGLVAAHEMASETSNSLRKKKKPIWESIYPQVLSLIRAHRSTLVFVNSRRIAERLAGALNELAGETLVYAHHGSLALPQRRQVESQLKQGLIRGLVATSSLELGIDMGAVDLVVQIEAPPSVASGMQRVGRANHQVGAVSKGVLFPKYQSDLVACAAVTRAMHEGQIEATHYPRNPLDVLAQQIVGMVSVDSWSVEALYELVCRSAPYVSLSRPLLESVLDMLSGRYPSDEFAELRPRVHWDRTHNRITARTGTRRLAVLNVGTIADRGLYGVFLAQPNGKKGLVRVGELDEEMVHETPVGETFVLGASTWRVEEITHNRVLVSPAPGESGKTPFWKGETPGRPLAFGRAIGALVRNLRTLPAPVAHTQLMREHDLSAEAAEQLLQYLDSQARSTQQVPDDENMVIERYQDELGDWRVCVMTPFGGRVHAPWCMAVVARLRTERHLPLVESLWADDGFVIRLPNTDQVPELSWFLPSPEQAEAQVLEQLGHSSLFAAKFRENAGCALLLPKHKPGLRTPLWQQRKRAADLFAIASRYSNFPLVLESLRECLQEVFDMPGLQEVLQGIHDKRIQVHGVVSQTPSPFAKSLLFSYTANFLYDGDVPLAERRAQALTLDPSHLRQLLGETSLRDLLLPEILETVEAERQGLTPRHQARNADDVHDLLLRIGDLTEEELKIRCVSSAVAYEIHDLVRAGRVVRILVQEQTRYIAIEDAARYRDALEVVLPSGIPPSLLFLVPHSLLELVRRYAHTHGPFTVSALVHRWGGIADAYLPLLQQLVQQGTVREGSFRPGETQHEFCDAEVLQRIRNQSLAQSRREVEAVPPQTLARLLVRWQGIQTPRQGIDALLDVIQSLQGMPLLLSTLEAEVLPARIKRYQPSQLDTLLAAGEVVWQGVESVGSHDARLALFLSDSQLLYHQPTPLESLSSQAQSLHQFLLQHGASFFAALHDSQGPVLQRETLEALWELVWAGLVSNDSFQALRAWQQGVGGKPGRPQSTPNTFRSRRTTTPPLGQGRWSLLPKSVVSKEEWSLALSEQLLQRYGVLTREAVLAENVPGGFSAVYPALKILEEAGRIRRGFFVAELGAAQFALPPAVDLLRTLRALPKEPEVVCLTATDLANPYGSILPWPSIVDGDADVTKGRLSRTGNAYVVLADGNLLAFFRKRGEELYTWIPPTEPAQSRLNQALMQGLTEWVRSHQPMGWVFHTINQQPAATHPLSALLQKTGFVLIGNALHWQPRRPFLPSLSVERPTYERFQSIAWEDPPEDK